MEDQKKICPIEETYFILKNYLAKIQYTSTFPSINEKTDFDNIGNYIDNLETELNSKSKLKSFEQNQSLQDLIHQWDVIVYLNDLSYYYIKNSSFLFVPYGKIASSFETSIQRLMKIKRLLKSKILKFDKLLKSSLEANNKYEPLRQFAENYVTYLEAVKDAKTPPLPDRILKKLEIDFVLIKNEAQKNIDLINFLLVLKEDKEVNEAFGAENFLSEEEDEEDEFFDALDNDDEEDEEDEFFDALEPPQTLLDKKSINDSSKLSFFEFILNWFKKLKNLLNKKSDYQTNKSDSTDDASQPSIIVQTSENPIPVKNNPALPTPTKNDKSHTHGHYTFYTPYQSKNIIDTETISNIAKLGLN